MIYDMVFSFFAFFCIIVELSVNVENKKEQKIKIKTKKEISLACCNVHYRKHQITLKRKNVYKEHEMRRKEVNATKYTVFLISYFMLYRLLIEICMP